MRVLLSLILLLFAGLSPLSPASAHTRSQSFSKWHGQENSVAFDFIVDSRRLTQLARLYDATQPLPSLLEKHLRETIQVRQDEKTCQMVKLDITLTQGGYQNAKGEFNCPDDITLGVPQISITSFHAVSPTHIHLARVGQGDSLRELVLSNRQSSFALDARQNQDRLTDFIELGFFHVLSGADHLAFLLALVFLAQGWRLAVFCITGFTLGHSLTLALAYLDVISPNEQLIESLIGLTIALAAFDIGSRRIRIDSGNEADISPSSYLPAHVPAVILATILLGICLIGSLSFWPFAGFLVLYVVADGQLPAPVKKRTLPVMASVFGLIHGAGFAGGLQHINLSAENIIAPLLGFNIGVELAQLLSLAIFLLFIRAMSKHAPHAGIWFRDLTAPLLFGLGLFWFAARLWS